MAKAWWERDEVGLYCPPLMLRGATLARGLPEAASRDEPLARPRARR